MGWLARLTLKDEGRQDLGLPWVVCEYEDIFSDELRTRVLLYRALHHGALRFCLLRRRTRLFDCALTIDS